MRDFNKPEPPPKPGHGDIWKLVLEDMEARRQMGIAKYGTVLQAGNGRDPLTDAYQEAQDLCVYMRQEIANRELIIQFLQEMEENHTPENQDAAWAFGVARTFVETLCIGGAVLRGRK